MKKIDFENFESDPRRPAPELEVKTLKLFIFAFKYFFYLQFFLMKYNR